MLAIVFSKTWKSRHDMTSKTL